MRMLKTFLVAMAFPLAITTAIVIMWSSYVSAGIVTINFPTDLASPCTLACLDTTADGFRISPEHHYDTVVVHPPNGLPGIGWDADGGVNPGYLGSSVPRFLFLPAFPMLGPASISTTMAFHLGS